MTLCGTRIPSHEDEDTSHTSQGIILFSSLAYTRTQGMDEEKSLTYLSNLSQGMGEESILITMLSLVTQLTMTYPGSHFGPQPPLQATPIDMHLDYLPKTHKPQFFIIPQN